VNLDGFAPASQWEELSTADRIPPTAKDQVVGVAAKGREAR
jgi:hypothetical protein